MTIEFPEEGLADDLKDFAAAKKQQGAKKLLLYGSRAKRPDHSGGDADTAAVFPQSGRKIIQHERRKGTRSGVLIHNRDVTEALAEEIEADFVTITLDD